MAFYKDMSEPFLLDSAKEYFTRCGIEVIEAEAANSLKIESLFESVRIGAGYLALPRKGRINIPVPYDPLFHDEYNINGKSIESILTDHVNTYLSSDKYLVSGRPDVFLAIKFSEFSYDILREIISGHLTTPLILFDKTGLRTMFFEYDLEINTYSRDISIARESLGRIENSTWISYFNKNFLTAISYNENHVGIIKKYYGEIMPDLNIDGGR